MSTIYRVTIQRKLHQGPTSDKSSTSEFQETDNLITEDTKALAGFLRAKADQLDPPTLKTTFRGGTFDA